ncbi:MAG: hypothetical protein INR71_00445 [Terriglobus roseus]|nr:hypothetical protein [Terriglobus roseus]
MSFVFLDPFIVFLLLNFAVMAAHISSILDSIRQQGQSFVGNAGEQARQALLHQARQLVASLESPAERLGRMNYLEV